MSQDRKFALLMLAGFLLLAAFLFSFFLIVSEPNYWHEGEINSYLTHTFFIVDQGFFAEIPYWHHGYGLVLSSLYQPFFFMANLALYWVFSLAGAASVYWAYALTILLSYAFAFFATWKISRGNSLVYLLTVGNFVSLGLLVLTGIVTKIFAFNLAFPGIIYLLDKRHGLEMGRKEIAAFSLLIAAVFASHIYVFLMFSLLYLGVLLQNRKVFLKGLIPFATLPVFTLPYLVRFVPAFLETASETPIWSIPLGLSLNFFMLVFVAFLALFAAVRELHLAPLALVALVFALNLNMAIPLISSMRGNFTALFFLAVIFYYLLNYGFSERVKLPKIPKWFSRERALIALLFALLALNFAYFSPKIEEMNLFKDPEYAPLLEFGELESVYFVADMSQELDPMLKIYVSYQAFTYHNYTVNAWFPLGKSHVAFSKDEALMLQALRENDCELLQQMSEKMRLRTLLIKNLGEDFACELEVKAEIGNFTILQNE